MKAPDHRERQPTDIKKCVKNVIRKQFATKTKEERKRGEEGKREKAEHRSSRITSLACPNSSLFIDEGGMKEQTGLKNPPRLK